MASRPVAVVPSRALGQSDRPSGARARGREQDLALVGEVSNLLDPSHIHESLDRALDLLREETGADAAEVFRLEPGSGVLLQTAYRGDDPGPFSERGRFKLGSGFPGLAALTGRPVCSSDLPKDDRFLREGVKAREFRSFISAPLGEPGRIIGTLDLAWKTNRVDLDQIARLLGWLARPVGNALLAAATARLSDAEAASTSPRERLTTVSGADQVALIQIGAPTGPPGDPAEGPWDASYSQCRLVQKAGLRVLGGDSAGWPRPCRERCGPARTRYCLPLSQEGVLRGVVRLSYSGEVPFPLARHAVSAMEVAESWARGELRPFLSPPEQKEVAAPRLELRCFGTFEVSVDGEPLLRSSFSRKKALELLQLLTLNNGRAVSGPRLAHLLWPGVDPDAGRNRLHGVVHALRKALEGALGPDEPDLVVRRDNLYSLNPSPALKVDIWEFRRLLNRARAAEAAGEPASRIAALLHRAVELYRGDLFADLPDAIWGIDPRSRFRERCVNALLELQQVEHARGRPDEAIHLLRKAVAIDRLREDVHVTLIRGLLAQGRRRDALADYRSLCRVLAEELDVQPSAEARKLRAEMKDA